MTRDEAIGWFIKTAEDAINGGVYIYRNEVSKQLEEAKAALAEPVGPNDRDSAFDLGYQIARDEIARALEARLGELRRDVRVEIIEAPQMLSELAAVIRDGSIREWLPKGGA